MRLRSRRGADILDFLFYSNKCSYIRIYSCKDALLRVWIKNPIRPQRHIVLCERLELHILGS
jgi:hypothetical protein